jgi:tetratricopeptide (TPR) repeat protein
MRLRHVTTVTLSFIFLTACSGDPSAKKLGYLQSGDRYFDAGHYNEAVVQFRNALQIDPRFAAAHRQLGMAYLGLKNPESAFRELSSAVALDPANNSSRILLAELELQRRQYSDAQSNVQQILKSEPENAQAHAILGRKNLMTRNLPTAIVELEKVVSLKKGDPASYAALGATYLAAGRPEDAEAAYRKAVEANPKSVDARVALGEFYFTQKRLSQSEAEMRAASRLDSAAVAPRIFLGRILITEQRQSDAEELYSQLKSVSPNDPQAYRALGSFYYATGQKEKALTEFEVLSKSKPGDEMVKAWYIETLIDLNRLPEAAARLRDSPVKAAGNKVDAESGSLNLISRGRMLIAQAKYPEAVSALQSVVAAEPGSATGYYYLGIAQQSSGQLTLAKGSFNQALTLAPEMSQAAAALANIEINSGNQGQALKEADQAIRGNPALASGYVAKGRALIATGDIRNGAAAIQQALRDEPMNLSALAVLMNLSIQQGKAAAAVARINQLLDEHENNAGLQFLAGLGEFSLKHLDKAAMHAKRAIDLDSQTPQAWTLMANIDFANLQSEKAKADLRNAIAVNPSTGSNYIALGTQYEKERNWEEAKKLFARAHDLDRNSPWIAAELAFLYIEHGGDLNIALALAQQARQERPESPITGDALGWAYYKIGSANLAIKELEETVHKTPGNPVYQFHLGMAYADAHRWDKAAESLRTALREDSNFPYALDARTALDQIRQRKN